MQSPPDVTGRLLALENDLAASRAQLRDIAMMGTVITRIHEIDAVLSVCMDMSVRLIDGEVGVILLDDGHGLKKQVSWGVGGEFIKTLRYKDDLDLATYCITHREAVRLSGLGLRSDEGRALESLIAVPIQTREDCLGVMVVINKCNGGGFIEHDAESLEVLLNFVAVAIENSRLMADKLARQKIEQEMAIAKQIQETILPNEDIRVEGADIGAVYFPAGDVGGDFYDIMQISDSRFLVILGDVSNKGVPAALVMSASSGIIKSVVEADPEIPVGDLAGKLNDLLATTIIKEREMFVTLFFACFDLEKRELSYCNAGHLPGLFWSNEEQSITELSDGGPIVGQFEGFAFKQGSRSLRSGDRLFVFTDGLTEAADREGNLFGRERAEQVFGAEIGQEPKAFCLRVKEWIDRFTEGAPAETVDDFTILQVKVN